MRLLRRCSDSEYFTARRVHTPPLHTREMLGLLALTPMTITSASSVPGSPECLRKAAQCRITNSLEVGILCQDLHALQAHLGVVLGVHSSQLCRTRCRFVESSLVHHADNLECGVVHVGKIRRPCCGPTCIHAPADRHVDGINRKHARGAWGDPVDGIPSA